MIRLLWAQVWAAKQGGTGRLKTKRLKTKVLLEKWGDEHVQLGLKSCPRKKSIWQEIGDFLMVC